MLVAACGGGGGRNDIDNPPAPLNITVSALDDGIVGAAYSQEVFVTGGTGTKTFSLTGSLPAGLALAADGTISGTPTGPAGSTDFTVTVTDSATPAQTDSQAFTMRIADPLVADAGNPPLAQVGVAYGHTVAVSGGIPPYSFAVVLPAGLSVDGEGVISGTPEAGARTAVSTATVMDSASPVQSVAIDLHLPVMLEVATTLLPDAIGGAEYDGRLEADGGLPELIWQKTGGTLPLGVAPDGSVVGFAPASCASANFTLDVSVTDSDSPAQIASRTGITLAVEPRAVGLPVSSSPVASIGEPFSFDIAVDPGVEPYAFSVVTGGLPPGISLNGISGHLQGAPTTGGTYNFTVEVTDACATTASRAFTIIIRSPPTGRNDTLGTATPVGNGNILASISPSGHPNTEFEPDQDYYEVRTNSTSTITVDLSAINDNMDTVVELLTAGGSRLQTCGAPSFTDECMNDDRAEGNLDSLLEVRVTGASTFYIHVVEWRGDARPDLRYRLELSGIN
ncbi:MAG TPA: Ig domain-containing protein [Steroidobacteraceae bacterium]|nr:Ig domain-containing protein [Steroidobacteraceae bacterium]